MVKQVLKFIAVLVLLASATAAQPSTCTVSGTVYLGPGTVAPNVRLRITPLSVTGVPMSSASFTATSDAAGLLTFVAVRGGTYKIEGPVLGYSSSGGCNVTIPSSSTALLSALLCVTTYPTTGLTVKDEGTALSSLYGTLNFVGSGVTATDVAGVATITIPGSSGVVSSVFGRTGAVVAASNDYTFAQLASIPTTLAGYGITDAVPDTRTVNGHALSSNVTVTASDVSLGSVTNDAQTKASIVPNTVPSGGQIVGGNAGGTAYAPVSLSGSGATFSLSSAGVLTVSGVANASLSNSSITIAGNSTALGASVSQDSITGLSSTGLVKRTGTNTLGVATSGAGNDYVAPGAATGSGLTMATARLLGRTTASSGAIEEISVGTGLSLSGGSLTATGSGATTALDNLTSVNINSALLAQTGIDLGSTTKPFRDAYLSGSGTYGTTSIKLTGTPTGARVVTFPDSSTSIPIISQTLTFSGPTQARTITFPDAAITVARTDAANTFTGHQTIEGVATTGATGTGNLVFSASPTFTGTAAVAAFTVSGTIVQTSASAAAFESGPNGSISPTLRIINNVASAASGVSIAGQADGTAPILLSLSRTQQASSIAGNGLAITADPAIAGSANAGAAAGGNITLTAGAAARLTSGNANGGNITLTPGAGIGTGVIGQVIMSLSGTTAAAPGLTFGDSTTGFYRPAANQLGFSVSGSEVMKLTSSVLSVMGNVEQMDGSVGYRVQNAFQYAFASSNSANSTIDVAFERTGVNAVELNNGTLGQWGALKVGVRDSGTTTVTNGLTVGHQSSGTPAAGLGSAVLFNINSSTSADQQAAQIAASWSDATHATRTADIIFSNVLSAAALGETLRIKANGLLLVPQTITAGGTTGAQTINKDAGTVNVAALGTSVVVTNSLVTTSSTVHVTARTNDSTCSVKNVVPGSGSFTINLTAACTAETSFGFWVLN